MIVFNEREQRKEGRQEGGGREGGREEKRFNAICRMSSIFLTNNIRYEKKYVRLHYVEHVGILTVKITLSPGEERTSYIKYYA